MMAFKKGMMNIRKAGKDDKVTMGNGHVEMTTEIRDMPGVVCNRNRNKVTSTILKDVAIVPSSGYNLFSLTKLMKAGWWILSRKDNKLTLTRNKQEIVFDIEIPTPNGVIYAMYIEHESEIMGTTMDKSTKMSIKQTHEKLGHSAEDTTRKTAKQLGWTLSPGMLEPCDVCAAAKGKQKNVPKNRDEEKTTKKEG
jgi:hypothetical protein